MSTKITLLRVNSNISYLVNLVLMLDLPALLRTSSKLESANFDFHLPIFRKLYGCITMSQITPEMLATMRPEQMTPEILSWLNKLAEENASRPLLNVCIAFIILQTVFLAVFIVSRRISGTMNGIEFWWFMPLAYFFSMANIIVTIRKNSCFQY